MPPSPASAASAAELHRQPGTAWGSERGAGLVASIFGLSFFLAFMLLAVQLLWSAYATSMVTAAAYDAGRAAARTGDPAAAIERFESSVGGFDADITVSVPAGPAPIVVEVSGRNPTLLPARVASRLPFGTIERTILIRREVFVPHA